MIASTPASEGPQIHLSPVGQPRVLIVSDSAERLAGLRALLNTGGVEITGATSLEEASRACERRQDLAVVDVAPPLLAGVLRALRSSAGSVESSVLVEASRLGAGDDLNGVLPRYRAMPCGRADLIALARRRTSPAAGRRSAKRIL